MPDWMTTPDAYLIIALAFVTLVLMTIPLLDRRHKRRKDQPGARNRMFRETMVMLWSMAGIAVMGWVLSGRSLADIGFAPVANDLQGWLALGLTGLALAYCAWQVFGVLASRQSRISVRKQLEGVELDTMRPSNTSEALHFQAVSITAGVTEEVIFRGVVIGALALVLPFWAAVVVSLIAFTLPHAYQGLAGMARVLPTGAVLTAIVLLGGSLWPAILAHIVVDMTAGLTFAILDRFEASDAAAEPEPEPDERVTAQA